jgi:hypothetical protein
MSMDRAYVNAEEGFACCCWNAPSREELAGLFEKAGTPFERMMRVEEYGGSG